MQDWCMALSTADTTNSTLSVQVTPVSAALGAEVRGIRLADVDQQQADEIKALLTEHMVLFFPDQFMNEDEHIRLGHLFGLVEGHPNLANPYTDRDELFEIAASNGGVADEWHTDLTFQSSPALMSILNMVDCPENGGDTMWTNLCLAYDALSAPMKDLCDGLTALHDAHPHGRPDKMTIHPVVRLHPDDGRKALYVNEHFTRRIVEMSDTESDALLRLLIGWVSQPRFTVRHRWTKGTIAMWDNRCTQHCVVNDVEGERLIQRVTISGDKPVGPPSRWEPYTPLRGAASRLDRQLVDFLANGSA